MKRKVSVILGICILMLIALSSCSLDEALDRLQGNKYIEWGWAEIDTASVDAVVAIVDNMSKNEVTVKDDILSLEDNPALDSIKNALEALAGEGPSGNVSLNLGDRSEIIKTNGILASQSETEKNNLNNSVTAALNGATRDKFVDEMKQSAPADQSDAAKGSMALTAAVIDKVKKQIEGDDGQIDSSLKPIFDTIDTLQKELDSKSKNDEALTKADVVQVQMITNLVNSAASVVGSDVFEGSSADEIVNNPAVKSLINDAVVLSNTTKALSGDVDLLTIPAIGDIIGMINDSNDESSDEPSPAPAARARVLRVMSFESDEQENDQNEGFTWDGDVLVSPPMGEIDPDDKSTSVEIMHGFLEDLFACSKNGNGVYQLPADFRTRLNAMANLSVAYDVMYSVIPTIGDARTGAFSYIADQRKASLGNALDYIYSSVLAILDRVLADEGLSFIGEFNEFLSLNSWISTGDMKPDTRLKIQADLIHAFGINVDASGSPNSSESDETNENMPVESNEDILKQIMYSIEDDLLTKTDVIDKMMAVGDFDIMEYFGSDEDVDSFRELVKKMYSDMRTEETEEVQG